MKSSSFFYSVFRFGTEKVPHYHHVSRKQADVPTFSPQEEAVTRVAHAAIQQTTTAPTHKLTAQ